MNRIESPSSPPNRTRTALMQAGEKLLAERSIDALTIDDIVSEAAVAKGSFYNHFDDKQDFEQAVAQHLQGSLTDLVERMNAGIEDPAVRIIRAFCFCVLMARADSSRARVLMRTNKFMTDETDPVNKGIFSDISSGLQSGRFAVTTTEMGVLLCMAVTRMGVERVANEDYSIERAAIMVQQLGGLVLSGLGVERAEAFQIAAQTVDKTLNP